jgi:hypothetical protein
VAIRCPHCECRVPFNPKMWTGPIYSSGGIILNGQMDEKLGAVKPGNGRFYASYMLRSSGYTIVDCVNCSKEFIAQNVPPQVIWPIPMVRVPSEIPEGVRRAFVEAKRAHAVGADVPALLGARTALTRMQREQGCSRIDELAEHGKISRLLAGQANELRRWANMTGHEDVDNPSPEDVEQLLSYMDLLFDAVYVQPAKLAALQAKRDGTE